MRFPGTKKPISTSAQVPAKESEKVIEDRIPYFCRVCGKTLDDWKTGYTDEIEHWGFCPEWQKDRTHDAVLRYKEPKKLLYDSKTGEKL